MAKVRKSTSKKTQNILGYTFMLPWILGFLIFTAIPFVYTIYLSFHDVSLTVEGWTTNFSGINNYTIAFFRNTEFTPALVYFIIMEITYAPAIIVISFILALLLNRDIKFRGAFRVLYFLPVIVMSGPVMYQLMDSGSTSTIGIEEMALFRIVLNYSTLLAQGLIFMFENYSLILWFTGIPIILFISGLQKIDSSILEAATIDSATSWQILWKITIPILRPIFLVCTIFTVVQLGQYTVNPVYSIIQEAIYNTVSGLGLASAYAWIYSVIVLFLLGIVFLFLKNPKEVLVKEQKRLAKRNW